MIERLLALCLLVAALPAQAGIEAGVNVANRYIYRGIDLSGNDPALQGRLEIASDLGFYTGVWASSAETDYDDRTAELDFFAGYQRRVHPALALDATAIRYDYTGGSVGDTYDWSEAQLTAHVGDHWAFTAAVADDWFGWSGTTWSAEASWHYAPGPRWLVDATVGHNVVREALGFNYQWAEIGLTRQFGPAHARIGYSATTGASFFGDLSDDRWLLTVGWDTSR